jgi:hypothetical protein
LLLADVKERIVLLEKFGAGTAIAIVRWASRPVVDWFNARRASRSALAENDVTGQGGLPALVTQEIMALARQDNASLPAGLQPVAFKNWLLDTANLPRFVEIVIAYGDSRPEAAAIAEQMLLNSYNNTTHDLRAPIAEQVKIVASYILGRVNSTDKGKQALQLALQRWIASEIYARNQSQLIQAPSVRDLEAAKFLAADLIEAGSRAWKVPRFVAPLRIETQDKATECENHAISNADVAAAIDEGRNFLLFGEGGIGKTTYLLDLATTCLRTGRRIPVFLDVPAWAQANMGLFAYVASRQAAITHGVTVAMLTRLALDGRLAMFLNGWNEMPSATRLNCRTELIDATVSARPLNVVATSRSTSDAPNLPDTRIAEVRGLTWKGQSAVVSAELPGSSGPLIELLA